jgi:predicted DCC family thiol-disulfide oxidoreductase YuxK
VSEETLCILYDGGCPLCRREIRFLERLDRGRGRLAFQDIESPDFDPTRHGLGREQVMARIHATLPDGGVIEGMEVFRRAYAAVGLGWLLAPTRWPGLRRVADAAYSLFARNRLALTGRSHRCEADRCTPRLAAGTGTPTRSGDLR